MLDVFSPDAVEEVRRATACPRVGMCQAHARLGPVPGHGGRPPSGTFGHLGEVLGVGIGNGWIGCVRRVWFHNCQGIEWVSHHTGSLERP